MDNPFEILQKEIKDLKEMILALHKRIEEMQAEQEWEWPDQMDTKMAGKYLGRTRGKEYTTSWVSKLCKAGHFKKYYNGKGKPFFEKSELDKYQKGQMMFIEPSEIRF